jgi:hypothetical protein
MSSAASSKPTQRPWTVATVGLLFFCIHARWFVRCADQRLEGVLGFGAVLIVLGIWLAARPGIEQMTADAQPRGLGVTPPSPEMTKKRREHLAVTHPSRWLRDQSHLQGKCCACWATVAVDARLRSSTHTDMPRHARRPCRCSRRAGGGSEFYKKPRHPWAGLGGARVVGVGRKAQNSPRALSSQTSVSELGRQCDSIETTVCIRSDAPRPAA